MDSLTKELIKHLLPESIEGKEVTALFGGGFKPPTAGHLEVIQKAIQQYPEIDNIVIFVGGKVRDGITQEQSYKIWEDYYKNLIDRPVRVLKSKSPIGDIYRYSKDNPNDTLYWLLGAREDKKEDIEDIASRTISIEKYPNLIHKTISTPGGGMSGTNARIALKNNDIEAFKTYLPDNVDKNEVLDILVTQQLNEINLKKSKDKLKTLAQNFKNAFSSQKEDFKGFKPLVLKYLTKQPITDEEKEKLKRNFSDILKTSGVAVSFPVLGVTGTTLLGWLTNKLTKGKFTTLPSKFKDELLEIELQKKFDRIEYYKNYYSNLSPSDFKVSREGDSIKIDNIVTPEIHLKGPKFDSIETISIKLYETLGEITLSKDNAVSINGNPTDGSFTVDNQTYKYKISPLKNLYGEPGTFYNVYFHPEGDDSSVPLGGKENYIKILSTMYKIIVDFVEMFQPDYIGISSLDNTGNKNYHKVYANLTNNQSNNIPGYYRKDVALPFNSDRGTGKFVVMKRKEQLNENASYSNHIDYKQQIKNLTKYMLDKGMNIKPLPKVVFYHGNIENAKDFFGKTAYYNPNTMEIVLYTEGRHPKDIVRSFSHEMIHHTQNLEDRLGNISTTNTNEDDHLTKIEAEANLKGTMTFRGWTDSLQESKSKTSPFSKNIEKHILSDIKEYGEILEFKTNLEDTYQYSSDSNFWEFYDDVNDVKIIANLKPTSQDIPEFKFYSLQDGKQLSFSRLKHYNSKVMNTIFKIFIDEVLPKNSKILIQPFDYLRYRLFRAMLNNNLDGNQYKIDTKDDPMGQSILLIQKLNESNKPYKHKHGFDKNLGKDPFGLNQFARELAQGLEEVVTEDSIKCDKCGWMWKIEDGGDDLYTCHKCGNNNTPSLNEGKYDKLTKQISSDIFRTWKQDYDSGLKSSEFYELYDFGPYGLEVEGNIEYKPNKEKLTVDGGADDSSRKTPAFIKADFIVDPKLLPDDFPEIAMSLKDVIRHEIEHITQSGRAKAGKYTRDLKTGKLKFQGKDFADDQLIRNMINMEFLPRAEYFKLEKEVDANLQGMYLRAKKERRPFRDVIDEYLDSQNITPEEKEEILDLWRTRLPALNLPKF